MATESRVQDSTKHQRRCRNSWVRSARIRLRPRAFTRVWLGCVSLRGPGCVQGVPSAHAGGASRGRNAGRAGRDARRATVDRRPMRLEPRRARIGFPKSPDVRVMRRSDARRALRDLVLPRGGMRDESHFEGGASRARESRRPRLVLLHEAGDFAHGGESERNRAAVVEARRRAQRRVGARRVESSKPKKRSIRQLPSCCRSRKATYLPYSVMRTPLESRQDCWKAPNSVAWSGAWSGATRRVETIRRRSMSCTETQLLRAIAPRPVGPRTVLIAGHWNTPGAG